MPKFDLVVSTEVLRTARVMQLEGIFEVAPTLRSELRWKGELPIEGREWSIGMIVGPSGSGKSTLARQVFQKELVNGFEWHPDKSILDAFPADMSIKQITGLLSRVGFSSPPSWLRPFRCLSNGEQFRVTLARAMSLREAIASHGSQKRQDQTKAARARAEKLSAIASLVKP